MVDGYFFYVYNKQKGFKNVLIYVPYVLIEKEKLFECKILIALIHLAT